MTTLLKILITSFALGTALLAPAQTPNALTPQEKQQGWQLLFDGKTTSGWHNYGKKNLGPAWRVDNGALQMRNTNRAGNRTPGGGDIVTDATFSGDFEFKAEWKIDRLGNSGIFFFVTESAQYPEMHDSGLELQVLDNAIYASASPDNKRRAGDFFGIVSTGISEAKPVGEWNQIHVIYRQGTMKVSMNGFQIHDIAFNGNVWKEAVAKSKLKDAPVGQGKFAGRIGLQDWGSTVWYRNLKIRPL